jgi:hypothetical protein
MRGFMDVDLYLLDLRYATTQGESYLPTDHAPDTLATNLLPIFLWVFIKQFLILLHCMPSRLSQVMSQVTKYGTRISV